MKDTPPRRRLSTHISTAQTRRSVDAFLRDDINNHTRSDISLDDFLWNALFFDFSVWEERIKSWEFHQSPEYKQFADKYQACKPETAGYPVFRDWAVAIITAAKNRFPELSKVNLKLHALGNTVPKGGFGCRKPDLAGTAEDIETGLLDWLHTYFVIEFKRKREKKLVPVQEVEGEDVFGSTGSKRKQSTQQQSGGKKAKTASGGQNATDVGPAIKRTSGSKKQGSNSKRPSNTGSKRSAEREPMAPGRNLQEEIPIEEEEANLDETDERSALPRLNRMV